LWGRPASWKVASIYKNPSPISLNRGRKRKGKKQGWVNKKILAQYILEVKAFSADRRGACGRNWNNDFNKGRGFGGKSWVTNLGGLGRDRKR